MQADCVLCGESVRGAEPEGEPRSVAFSCVTLEMCSHLLDKHPEVWMDISVIMGEVGQVIASFWARGGNPHEWETEQKVAMDAVLEEMKQYVIKAAAKSYGAPALVAGGGV